MRAGNATRARGRHAGGKRKGSREQEKGRKEDLFNEKLKRKFHECHKNLDLFHECYINFRISSSATKIFTGAIYATSVHELLIFNEMFLGEVSQLGEMSSLSPRTLSSLFPLTALPCIIPGLTAQINGVAWQKRRPAVRPDACQPRG